MSFDAFWAAYPRRIAKKDAVKAWAQVGGDAHAAEILAALEWQGPILRQSEERYRPHPATWLRGGRWTDEMPAEVAEARRRADREHTRQADLERQYREAYERRHGRTG